MTDLTCIVTTVTQLAFEDEATTDARSDEHTEEIAVRASGSAPEFSHDGDTHVVVDGDRNPSKGRADGWTKGYIVGESRHVGSLGHVPGGDVHRTGRANSDGIQI
jgi:hypothetical protein